MPQPNILQASQPSGDVTYRADVSATGDVSLVAFPNAVSVPPRIGTAQSIALTAERYAELHAMFAAPHLKLMYIDSQFEAKTIGTVS